MVLVHGGGPGVEKIAASWAERNGVHQVVCKPDWDRHGRAAPFRRNDELLNLLPKGVIAFPGSGITENLVDKARTLGIPVQRIAARFFVRTSVARSLLRHAPLHHAAHECSACRADPGAVLPALPRALHGASLPLYRRGGSPPPSSPASMPP